MEESRARAKTFRGSAERARSVIFSQIQITEILRQSAMSQEYRDAPFRFGYDLKLLRLRGFEMLMDRLRWFQESVRIVESLRR
jgi:hypothetical protein